MTETGHFVHVYMCVHRLRVCLCVCVHVCVYDRQDILCMYVFVHRLCVGAQAVCVCVCVQAVCV